MTKRLFYYLFIFLLSSCAAGPDFVSPPTPQVSAYTSKGNIQTVGRQHLYLDQPVSQNWWNEFHSPALNAVIRQGIKNSYTLEAAQETLQQAQENVNAAKGALLPQVAATAGAGQQEYGVATFGPSPFSIPPFTYYTLGAGANWTLDIFGETQRTIEQQQALTDYQKALTHAAFLSLTGNITVTALEIAAINAQIAQTKEIIKEDQRNLNLVQKEWELGSATKVDILSAQSQLQNDETLLPPLHQQLAEAKGKFNILLGTFPANWQPPHFELDNFTLPQKLPLSLPSELVRNRPDILAAEALLHAACANIGIATANLYPQITLSASTSQQALEPANLFDASSNASNLIAGLTTPIFNGGTLRAQRRAAVHAYKAAYANYQQTVVTAFVQVNNVLQALKNNEQEFVKQKKAYLTAKAALKLAQISYEAGSSDLLEVLNAERLHIQATLGYIKARAQRYQDTTQLYLALGGGIIAAPQSNHPSTKTSPGSEHR